MIAATCDTHIPTKVAMFVISTQSCLQREKMSNIHLFLVWLLKKGYIPNRNGDAMRTHSVVLIICYQKEWKKGRFHFRGLATRIHHSSATFIILEYFRMENFAFLEKNYFKMICNVQVVRIFLNNNAHFRLYCLVSPTFLVTTPILEQF